MYREQGRGLLGAMRLMPLIYCVYKQAYFASSIPLLYVMVERRCGCNFKVIVFNFKYQIEHRHIIISCLAGETALSLAELRFEIMADFTLLDIVHFMIIVFCFECRDTVIKYTSIQL